MQNEIRKLTTMIAAAGMLSVAACGHGNNQNSAGDVGTPAAQAPATTQSPAYGTSAATPDTTYEHHSKLKGALVGAAVGHMAGHHALAGAAAGALVQHERNKHH